MKILITGINGFIGKHLQRQLANRGHKVYGLPNIKRGVLNKKLASNAVDDAEVIVHLAGLTSHRDIVDNRFKTLELNLQGTKNILEAFSKSKTSRKFIYASTGKVYGNITRLPITEKHPTNPLNILGKSKFITEKLIDFYSDGGKEFVIFRIFNVYGPGQRENFLIPTILSQLNSEKKEIMLGDIKSKRDYVYIEDAVDAFVRAIERKVSESLSIYNICSGRSYSAEEIVRLISKIKKEDISFKSDPNKFRHDEAVNEYGSFTKAKKTFGWKPQVSLLQGLRRMIQGNMQAIVMAGGMGTRMKPLSNKTPKLLIPLNDKPFIDYLIKHLMENGCDNIIISAGYLGDQIKKYLEIHKFSVPIKLSVEKKPLGTGGALNLLKDQFNEDFFVIYGDVYTKINLQKMFEFHKKKKAVVTCAIHKSTHPDDSDLIQFNSDFRITSILRKPHKKIPKNPYNIAAIYVVNSKIKKYLLRKTPYDFSHDFLPKLLDENVPVYGYNTGELMIDIGTPERLRKIEKLLRK